MARREERTTTAPAGGPAAGETTAEAEGPWPKIRGFALEHRIGLIVVAAAFVLACAVYFVVQLIEEKRAQTVADRVSMLLYPKEKDGVTPKPDYEAALKEAEGTRGEKWVMKEVASLLFEDGSLDNRRRAREIAEAVKSRFRGGGDEILQDWAESLIAAVDANESFKPPEPEKEPAEGEGSADSPPPGTTEAPGFEYGPPLPGPPAAETTPEPTEASPGTAPGATTEEAAPEPGTPTQETPTEPEAPAEENAPGAPPESTSPETGGTPETKAPAPEAAPAADPADPQSSPEPARAATEKGEPPGE